MTRSFSFMNDLKSNTDILLQNLYKNAGSKIKRLHLDQWKEKASPVKS